MLYQTLSEVPCYAWVYWRCHVKLGLFAGATLRPALLEAQRNTQLYWRPLITPAFIEDVMLRFTLSDAPRYARFIRGTTLCSL